MDIDQSKLLNDIQEHINSHCLNVGTVAQGCSSIISNCAVSFITTNYDDANPIIKGRIMRLYKRMYFDMSVEKQNLPVANDTTLPITIKNFCGDKGEFVRQYMSAHAIGDREYADILYYNTIIYLENAYDRIKAQQRS